jgi:hypothetical protein
MQRLIKTIGYFLFVLLLLTSSSSFALAQEVETFDGEAPMTPLITTCKVTSATLGTRTEGRFPLVIKTSNCANWAVKVLITEIDTGINDTVEWISGETGNIINLDNSGTTDIILTPGDNECDDVVNTDCEIKITLTPIKFGSAQPLLGTEFALPGILKYDCQVKDHCNDGILWSLTTSANLATTCTIVSAEFNLSKDTGYVGQSDGNTHYVGSANAIIVTTKNCAGDDIYVTLVEGSVDSAGDAQTTNLDVSDGEPGVTNIKLTVPASEITRINLRAGEQRCNAGKNPDCVYFIVAGTAPFESISKIGTGYYSFGKPHGRLAYNCDGVCTDLWTYVSDNGAATPGDPNEIPVTDGGTLGDPNSACLDTEGKPIEGCYELYGGLGDLLKGKLDLIDNKFDVLKQDSLGGLLNGFIAIAIGIGGVLAVAMIMYEGFKYMKSDNANTKAEMKSSIVKTTLGFLLLLSIFVILRTINPDLLNLNPSITSITLDVADGQDPNEVLDAGVKNNPNLAKIYATSKGHWRDGGSVSPNDPASRKAMADGVPQADLLDISSTGITIKAGAGKYVHKSIAPKLINFNGALKAKNIAMTVTEAFKPTTYRHYASCQYKGTCVDADIPFNVTNVAIFISEAQKNGLVAVWETTSKANYNDLIKAGVPQSSVLLFGGAGASHITGDHASVYDYQ